MEPRIYLLVILTFLSLFIVGSSAQGNSSFRMQSLDSVVKDHALDSLDRRKTGTLYHVSLPSNLSGIEATVLRQRSNYIWTNGANFSSIKVPPKTRPVPFVRRLVIVYQDLGNWSETYYNVPGHSIVAPVVGLLAYDGSDVTSNVFRDVGLTNLASPITVTFHNVSLPQGLNSTAMKCASFGIGGEVQLTDMISNHVCTSTNTGHFTIVVPSIIGPAGSPVEQPKKNVKNKWMEYIVACVGAVVGLLVVCLLGVGVSRLAKNKKMGALERNAEQGEGLDSIWVGISKMPSAPMTRTSPIIEDKSSP